jgi:ATP-dependent Clp protease adapter protein ClpS
VDPVYASFILVASSLTAIALAGKALSASVASVARQRVLPPELEVLLSVAASEAHKRRHDLVTPDHLAYALLAVPDVVRAMRTRGIAGGELRAAFEARLAEHDRPDAAATSAAPAASPDLSRVLAVAIRAQRGPRDASAVMTSLVRALATDSQIPAREVFASHGVDADWLLLPEADCAPGGASGAPRQPYRATATPAKARVVFWNDDRSTMNGVIAVLREVFEMSEPEAMYVTLLVHKAGSAIARRCDEHEAAALAEQATLAARARGMPLRVTVELSDGKAGRRWFGWLRRRDRNRAA